MAITSLPTSPASNDNSAPSFWAQASTRWDIAKFAFPLLLAAIAALVTMYFAQLAQAGSIATLQAQVSTMPDRREKNAAHLASIDAQLTAHTSALNQINGSLRDQDGKITQILVLMRSPH